MDPKSARTTWQHFKEFLDKPFDANMDFIDLFMLIGLILIMMILWNIILKHIAEAI